MKVRAWAAAALAASLLATACGGDDTETPTRARPRPPPRRRPRTAPRRRATAPTGPRSWSSGLVPSREADKLVESAQPLADAMSEALGIEVEAFVPQDYTALTEAMASGQADVGAFGPLGVVRAIDQANVEFILQSERFGSYTYHTQYMTNAPDTYCTDEPAADEDGNLYCNGTLDADEGPAGADAIAKIEAGATLSYVDPTSTSGYLIPALQMIEAGVDLDALETSFAGGHDASVLAVYNGDVEVGLSFDDARGTIAEQFPDVGEKVVVFAYSEEIPNDGFVIRADLPDSLKQAFVDAMLEYASTDAGKETLDAIYEIGGLREGDEADLDVVRARRRRARRHLRGLTRDEVTDDGAGRVCAAGSPSSRPPRTVAGSRDPMIEFTNASVTYPGGVHALKDLTLTIPDGEMVVIVGLSGAGKSTLIRAVNGLVPLTSGSVVVDGQDLSDASGDELRRVRSRIGMIFQGFNLVKRTSVLNNVLMGRLYETPTWRTLLGRYRAADVELAMRALETVEIVEKAYVRASHLSGGQQQRVAIARALAQEPSIFLADEPVASLDPPTSHVVMRDLQRINRQLGMTVVTNLHFLDLARQYGDRIIGLRAGELVFDGEGAEVDEQVFEDIYGRSLTADDVMGRNEPAL